MEVSQSIQQTTYDQFHKVIKENATNKQEIAKIIVQILENSSLYTFSEFLQLPEINEVIEVAKRDIIKSLISLPIPLQLKTGEFEKHYNTLNLFAFGTYRQHLENKDKLLQLTAVMDRKLKHLTILTLATQKKTLPYDDLMNELDLKNVRHLEDIIIEAIYAGKWNSFYKLFGINCECFRIN